ncbi:beta strand repeat-containing protein, partial [Bradyrhizobium sp. LjRoot220]|uniref:beta strand repeat-containing protein n=1 Tax=Bradyrhizobium sp. LjRoot220 TaxID=3342284 RepID=UPI003F504F1B
MANLTVGTGGTYATIQAAIDVAADGDVIIVSAGTYNEDLIINVGVTIQGANAGLDGSGVRGAETIITGQSSITTSSQVTIDGVEFLDDKPLTSLTSGDNFVALKILTQAATVTGHVIENSIFMRDPSSTTAPGFDANTFKGSGLQPTHRAIEIASVGAGTAITIENNLITGGNPYPYAGDDWRSGVYSNGGAGDTYIQNNTFENTRSGINADNFAPTVHITGNSFDHSGTGIAVGVGSDVANVTSITNNVFGVGVDSEFNFRNLTTGVTFDAEATGNSLSPAAVAANETFYIQAGSGSDHVSGTSGDDVFVAAAGDGNDSYDGSSGIDTVNYSPINGAGAQIIVNLASGTANGSAAGSGSDTFVSIENVIGTQLGDSLTGDINNNRLDGQAGDDDVRGADGDDTLIGGAGNDDLRGGADDDTAIFAATAADGIATQAGGVLTINAGTDGTDTVQTVEHLVFLGADGVAGGTGANEDITIDVDASGNAQVYALDDSGNAVEDGASASGNVLTNDINIDQGVGDEKIVTAVNGLGGGVGNGVSGSYGTLNLSSDGSYTYVPTSAVQSLGVGDLVTDTFTYDVDDGSGNPATANLVITITGSNDAPTVDVGGAATGVYAGGALDNVVTADVAANNKFEPVQQIDVAAMLALDPTTIDMDAVLTAIQGQLPAGSGRADAIAIVWDHIDDNYSYYNTYINTVSAFLSIEYANYLEGGGKPLLDVIVKYTPDGGDAGTAPDRVQSLHDNLLGNLSSGGLLDKLSTSGSNPAPNEAYYQAILAKLATEDMSDLLTRPYYSGNEGSTNNALAFDQANGLAGGASQLVATDVDGDTMTWSGNANGTYGTFAIAADGKWTYTVDNARAETRALAEGQAVTESFIATVTDQNGATATQTVTVTVNGSNDIAQLGFNQGFESDSAGILSGMVAGSDRGTIVRVASQLSANGTTVTAADGGQFAVLTDNTVNGGAGGSTGAFTRFDGYRSTFTDGLTSGVKVYLDTSWADNQGFEYSVAANGADGNHQRDFVFHVVSEGSGTLYVGGNNNAGFNSNDPAANSEEITQSGWYTLQHVFHDVGGVLSVDLNLVAEDGTVTHIATLSSPLDTIPAEVGGNRYGWFTSINVPGGIAVDTVTLGDTIGRVVEDSGSYSVDGLLPFSDVDTLDTHDVEVAPSSVGYLGTLTADLTEATATHGGAVTWNYTVDNADINHLA